MKYTIEYDEKVIKELKKIDKYQREILLKWIKKNLANTKEPREKGKSLKGNLGEYWRYRVGNYRIITSIDDERILITVISIGHSKDIYRF